MQSFFLSFVAGGLSTLSPCVLPILPMVVGSASQEHKHGPLALALGMILSFTLIGIFIASIGFSIGIDDSTIRSLAAILLIIAGIILMSTKFQEFFARSASPIASHAQNFINKSSPEGLKGQFLLGALLGAIWSPCTGPTLGAAIGLASQSGSQVTASLMMLLFGIGAALPLLGLAYGSRKAFMAKRDQLINFGSKAKIGFGMILLLLGLAILFGWDKLLEASVLNIMPEWLVDLTVRY